MFINDLDLEGLYAGDDDLSIELPEEDLKILEGDNDGDDDSNDSDERQRR